MPEIQLLDGKKIPFSKSINGFDLTKQISKSIEKSAEVESLQKDKTYTGVSEESKPDIVKETEAKEKVKSAKDWGRASNDPRNKS